jgi:ureidoglycolate hydrolase
MTENARSIEAGKFNAGEWSPYGWVPVADTDARAGEFTLFFEWADPHLNLIGHDADEVPHADGSLTCEMLFRHRTHTQALMVLNTPAVIAVAPADAVFAGPDDAAQVRAFLLEPRDVLVLHRGTWHWGPFPIGAPRVDMLNVQGRRYAEDNTCCRLDAIGASVRVLTDGHADH